MASLVSKLGGCAVVGRRCGEFGAVCGAGRTGSRQYAGLRGPAEDAPSAAAALIVDYVVVPLACGDSVVSPTILVQKLEDAETALQVAASALPVDLPVLAA